MGDDPSVFLYGIKEFVSISIIFLAVLLAMPGKGLLLRYTPPIKTAFFYI
jgi:hypothetical protein